MSHKLRKATARNAAPMFPQLSGEALQRMQRYSGLTVNAFCKQLGVATSTWRRWLEGDGAPSMEQLCRITELAAVYEQKNTFALFKSGLNELLNLLNDSLDKDAEAATSTRLPPPKQPSTHTK